MIPQKIYWFCSGRRLRTNISLPKTNWKWTVFHYFLLHLRNIKSIEVIFLLWKHNKGVYLGTLYLKNLNIWNTNSFFHCFFITSCKGYLIFINHTFSLKNTFWQVLFKWSWKRIVWNLQTDGWTDRPTDRKRSRQRKLPWIFRSYELKYIKWANLSSCSYSLIWFKCTNSVECTLFLNKGRCMDV